MTPHYFEFGTTTTIDWTRVETVYVKANCLQDALKYMRSVTDDEDTGGEKEFADFVYRTSVPECCLLNDIRVFDANEPPEVVVLFRRMDPIIDAFIFYAAEWNGRQIATFFNLKDSDEWSIVCYDEYQPFGTSKINWQYTGRSDTCEQAIDRIVAFAKSIAGASNDQ